MFKIFSLAFLMLFCLGAQQVLNATPSARSAEQAQEILNLKAAMKNNMLKNAFLKHLEKENLFFESISKDKNAKEIKASLDVANSFFAKLKAGDVVFAEGLLADNGNVKNAKALISKQILELKKNDKSYFILKRYALLEQAPVGGNPKVGDKFLYLIYTPIYDTKLASDLNLTITLRADGKYEISYFSYNSPKMQKALSVENTQSVQSTQNAQNATAVLVAQSVAASQKVAVVPVAQKVFRDAKVQSAIDKMKLEISSVEQVQIFDDFVQAEDKLLPTLNTAEVERAILKAKELFYANFKMDFASILKGEKNAYSEKRFYSLINNAIKDPKTSSCALLYDVQVKDGKYFNLRDTDKDKFVLLSYNLCYISEAQIRGEWVSGKYKSPPKKNYLNCINFYLLIKVDERYRASIVYCSDEDPRYFISKLSIDDMDLSFFENENKIIDIIGFERESFYRYYRENALKALADNKTFWGSDLQGDKNKIRAIFLMREFLAYLSNNMKYEANAMLSSLPTRDRLSATALVDSFINPNKKLYPYHMITGKDSAASMARDGLYIYKPLISNIDSTFLLKGGSEGFIYLEMSLLSWGHWGDRFLPADLGSFKMEIKIDEKGKVYITSFVKTSR